MGFAGAKCANCKSTKVNRIANAPFTWIFKCQVCGKYTEYYVNSYIKLVLGVLVSFILLLVPTMIIIDEYPKIAGILSFLIFCILIFWSFRWPGYKTKCHDDKPNYIGLIPWNRATKLFLFLVVLYLFWMLQRRFLS